MNDRLKKLRVEAGMTQAALAEAIGVSQPNYHRWESDKDPIPDDKLKKLAKVLKTTPEEVLGKQPPRRVALYDASAPRDLQYYGEVAIHFANGSKPLLLSLSEDAFQRLHSDLQHKQSFVTIKTLSNQYVIVRTKAISDLYFSSEAYDDFGPEHERDPSDLKGYDMDTQLPDDRDWSIIECIAGDGFGLEEFDEADVKRVEEMVMDYTDEEYQKLVVDGLIEPENLESERAKNSANIQRVFDLATNVQYRLSTGEERKVYIYDEDELYNAFSELVYVDQYSDFEDDDTIRFAVEGYHRCIFINRHAVDYISIPAHRFDAGAVKQLDEEIEFFDAAKRKPKSKNNVLPMTTAKKKKK